LELRFTKELHRFLIMFLYDGGVLSSRREVMSHVGAVFNEKDEFVVQTIEFNSIGSLDFGSE